MQVLYSPVASKSELHDQIARSPIVLISEIIVFLSDYLVEYWLGLLPFVPKNSILYHIFSASELGICMERLGSFRRCIQKLPAGFFWGCRQRFVKQFSHSRIIFGAQKKCYWEKMVGSRFTNLTNIARLGLARLAEMKTQQPKKQSCSTVIGIIYYCKY